MFDKEIRNMKFIKAFLFASILLTATHALADAPVPFVDTPTGKTARAQACLITTTEAEGTKEYAVVVRGDAGEWHVIPAILTTKVPNGTLGRPSVITAIMEEESKGNAPPRKRLNITKIEPLAW